MTKYYRLDNEYYTFSFSPPKEFIECTKIEYDNYIATLPEQKPQPTCFLDKTSTFFCLTCPFITNCSNKKS